MKPNAPSIKKPAFNADAALAFATGEAKTAEPKPVPRKTEKAPTEAGKRVFYAPEGYQRLTINLRNELHTRLKVAATVQGSNVGKILESLIEDYLARPDVDAQIKGLLG